MTLCRDGARSTVVVLVRAAARDAAVLSTHKERTCLDQPGGAELSPGVEDGAQAGDAMQSSWSTGEFPLPSVLACNRMGVRG